MKRFALWVLMLAAFSLGNALGAFLGGIVVASSFRLMATGWVGALMTLAGLIVALASLSFDRRWS